MKYDAI